MLGKLTRDYCTVKMKPMRHYVILLILIATGCGEEKSSEVTIPLKGDQEVYRVEITQSRLDKKVWKLQAMSVFENGDTIKFYRFKVIFYGPANVPSSVLEADSGLLNKKTENMEAFGDVKIFFKKDSTRVFTSHIVYDSRKRLIKGDKNVKILTPDGEVLGTGFVTDPEMRHIKIFGKVRGYGRKG